MLNAKSGTLISRIILPEESYSLYSLVVKKTNQIVPVGQLPRMAHSHVHVAAGFNPHDLDDLSLSIDLEQTFRRALRDQRVSVGQPLATPNFAASCYTPRPLPCRA